MNVWLIYPYGSVPGDGYRPDRPEMLARALVGAGHTVTWWASSFDHRTKRLRSTGWQEIHPSRGFSIRLVPAREYSKHISFARIRFERHFAQEVAAQAAHEQPPDIIVLSEPALFIAGPLRPLIHRLGATLILDNKDLWPELFEIALPRLLRPIAHLLFAPWYARRASLFRKAHGVVAVSDTYLEISRRLAPQLDATALATVYFGVDVADIRGAMTREGPLPPALENRPRADGEVWAVYASTLGDNYDVRTILAAAERLQAAGSVVRIIIAGAGPLEELVRSTIASKGLTHAIFVGNPDAATLARVYAQCAVGLASYVRETPVTMPIKAFHYLAAGLPIVNSLTGDLAGLLARHDAGVQYEPENPASLADALDGVANDRVRLSKMAERAVRLGEQFDSKAQYGCMSDLIERVHAGRSTQLSSSVYRLIA